MLNQRNKPRGTAILGEIVANAHIKRPFSKPRARQFTSRTLRFPIEALNRAIITGLLFDSVMKVMTSWP